MKLESKYRVDAGVLRLARGVGLAMVAAWATQSCKSASDDFTCASDSECDVSPRTECRAGRCVVPGEGTGGAGDGGSGSSGSSGKGNGGAGDGGGSNGTGSTAGAGGKGSSGAGNGGSGDGGATTDPDGGPASGNRLTLVAGVLGGKGAIDGRRELARFDTPGCLAYDGSRYVYMGDEFGEIIRRIDTTTGDVVTIAGYPMQGGYVNGPGVDARFNRPECVAYDGRDAANPALYVAEFEGQRIRKIALTGNYAVSLVAGSPTTDAGLVDATGGAARFRNPEGMARGRGSILYVADLRNNVIRGVDVGTGQVTTVAGDATSGQAGSANGAALTARFNEPHGLVFDDAGNRLFIGERAGNRIRVLDLTANQVSTLVDGTGFIGSLAYDAVNGLLYASTIEDNKVLQVDVTSPGFATIAGSGDHAERDGSRLLAAFRNPHGLALTAPRTLFVGDFSGPTLRQLTGNASNAWETTTFAGLASQKGLTDATGPAARFNDPTDLELTPDGAALYVSDYQNCAIRTVQLETRAVRTVVGGAGCGSVDGTGVSAQLAQPTQMALGVPATPGGAVPLFVAEDHGVVRKIDTTTREVTRLNPALTEELTWHGITATATTVFVTDEWGRKIRQIPAAGGPVTDFAGSGNDACTDSSLAISSFGRVGGILSDGEKYLFVADYGCRAIRRIDLDAGTVLTVAGGGTGASPDGTGAGARFAGPNQLAWDREKNGFYVQDAHVVRWVDATSFEVKTVVGDPDSHGGVWLPPAPARLNFPGGLVEAADGNLYIASEQAILAWKLD